MFPRLGYARVWGKRTAALAGMTVPAPSGKALRDLRRRIGPAPPKALFEVVAGPPAGASVRPLPWGGPAGARRPQASAVPQDQVRLIRHQPSATARSLAPDCPARRRRGKAPSPSPYLSGMQWVSLQAGPITERSSHGVHMTEAAPDQRRRWPRAATGCQPLRVPFSVPVKRAPAPNVWKLAVPDSPSNWPVPPVNAMLSSSTKGLPYEMAPACWCPVPDGSGQKRPVSGPRMVLLSDCSVIVRVPSTSKQRPSGSKAGPKTYAQPAAPSPASCMVPHSSATPEGHWPAKLGLRIAVENEPSRVTEALAPAGAIATIPVARMIVMMTKNRRIAGMAPGSAGRLTRS